MEAQGQAGRVTACAAPVSGFQVEVIDSVNRIAWCTV